VTFGFEEMSRKGVDDHLRGFAELDPGQILFVDIGDHPDGGQVGDAVDDRSGHETHPFDGLLFEHHAGGRRGKGDQRVLRTGRAGNLPVAQPFASGFRQTAGALAGRRIGIAGALLERLGNAQFLLGGDQLRAIDGEQRLPLADRITGSAHLQPLDPAFEAWRDVVNPALVDLHPADRAQRRIQGAFFGTRGLDAECLDTRRADLDDAAAVGFVVFVDRDVVHAHRILLRFGRGIGQPHRIAVVEELAFVLAGGRGRGGRIAAGCVGHCHARTQWPAAACRTSSRLQGRRRWWRSRRLPGQI
jgi:hypothetical protein